MRIASLVPSATEMCFALGLGDDVVAVTHECDHPAATAALPRLTRSLIPAGLDAAAIDAAVRERIDAGESLYVLDASALADLEPDLIVTQQVCAVCAVSCDDVRAVAAGLPSRPAVLSLDPARLGDVLDDAETLAAAAGEPGAGTSLRAELEVRIGAVRSAVAAAPRPRVAAIEWLDPPYRAGHWLPEMIAAAGGSDALAAPGERSQEIGWGEVAAARPDVVVVMPCGLDADAAEAEARRHAAALAELGAEAFAVDAAASFSRPGPRLADGVELLGHLLHPTLVPAPPGLEARQLG
ncbi:MAG TPA: ABC transporter substrate-binding protein [Solirubrobacterales bacterium]|jgi:iron complex transport system substrate-binding protein|nr:ABC transporter substrate-binding protein [Solirubrobacterales bacterium]